MEHKWEVIMKKFSIILAIGTIILLVLNFIFKENLYLRSSTQLMLEENDRVIKIQELPTSGNFPETQAEAKALKSEKPSITAIEEEKKEDNSPQSTETKASSESPTEKSEKFETEAKETPAANKAGKRLINLDIEDIRIIFSGILLLCSMGILLFNKKDESLKKWAFGIIGSLMGFWLK